MACQLSLGGRLADDGPPLVDLSVTKFVKTFSAKQTAPISLHSPLSRSDISKFEVGQLGESQLLANTSAKAAAATKGAIRAGTMFNGMNLTFPMALDYRHE